MDPIASLTFFTPELLLIAAAFIVLMLHLLGVKNRWLGLLSVFFIASASASLIMVEKPTWIFSDLFLIDGLSLLFKLLVLIMSGIALLAAIESTLIPEKQKGEFFVLMILLTVFLVFMGSSTNLLMIYLATESVSITSYILAGFQKFNKRSSEAGLKYLLFGSVASATMLFGISLLFGLTGTLELVQMPIIITKGGIASIQCGLAALLFILVGLGFKISMAPFHMWAPDVYDGAPTPVAAFLTVAPKSFGFLVLFRVLLIAFGFLYVKWSNLLIVLSIITMTVGNVIAVSQVSAKRILAYSSIAQAGYILMGLAASNQIGIEALFLYITTYLFTNLGAFIVVSLVEDSEKNSLLVSFNGLSKRSPGLAALMTIFLLSLAGIPPLAGFVAKWYVFASAIQAKFIPLAIFAALNSAVGGYYYFKIIRAMYLTEADKNSPVPVQAFAKTALCLSIAGVVLIGLFPSPVIAAIQNALLGFRMV